MPLSWVVHCVDSSGKQGVRLGLMHPTGLAGAVIVPLTDTGMFMVNTLGKSAGEVDDLHLAMVTELLTLSQTVPGALPALLDSGFPLPCPC